MSRHPTDLKIVDENKLLIVWSDGQHRRYSFRELRDSCPCATCREKHRGAQQASNQLTVLSAAETQPLRIAEMKPVGTYAYTIAFSDGHSTGIYTFDLLQRLGEEMHSGEQLDVMH